MRIIIKILIIIICINLFGCGVPTEQEVISDFNKSNTDKIALSAHPGQGDNVYFHIKYKFKKNNNIKNEVWLYQRKIDTGEWSVSKKGISCKKHKKD